MKWLGLVLIAAFVVGSVSLFLALLLHEAAGSSLRPWTGYISDLSVGAGGASAVFVVMILGLAALTGWFFVAAPAELAKAFGSSIGAARVARVFGVLGALDLVAMAWVPLDPDRPSVYVTHIVTGVISFVCLSACMTAYGYLFRGRPGLFGVASVLGFVSGVGAFVFAGLLASTELLHVLRPAPVVYMVEWGTFVLLAAWMLITGAQLRRADSRAGS